jgi:outer membrane protein assembly factor BamB
MTLMVLLTAMLSMIQVTAPPSVEDLFDAARRGDRARVLQLLDAGVDVNAKGRYNTTALFFAADKGHLEVVRLLVERGADVNVADTFYKFRAIDMARSNGYAEIVKYLLDHGSRPAARDTPRPSAATPPVSVPATLLQSYAGNYRNEDAGLSITVAATDKGVSLTMPGQPPMAFTPSSENSFVAAEAPNLVVTFTGRGGMVEGLTVTRDGSTTRLDRITDGAPVRSDVAPARKPVTSSPTEAAPPTRSVAPRTKAAPWPSFRGPNASGVADGQGAVVEWDISSGKNVKWKTPIPGIAVSSPIVWGDRVFVTTAVGSDADKTFRTGLYGDVKPIDDLSPHTWRLYALDHRTGAIVWQRDVFSGAPKVKRHPKSSQASSTPATDGKHVVAVFGSIGRLVCFDVTGKQLWQRDIGIVDNGWFFDPTYQWGHSSSPIIYKSSVIVQVDQQKGSYLAAFDLATGKPLWRTERPDEISTWGTPTIVSSARGDEIVTNGTKVRGYNASTGKLLWTLGPNSEITVGTPVAGNDVVYVTGGYPPVRPVYAVKAGASGDITLPKGQTTNQAIAWSNDREGTYIPTPLLYRDILYTLNSNGILTAYNARSGERLYRARVGGGGAFAASPVAADGRIYFANEDGDIFIVQAGAEYVELGKYSTNEVIMATPAISNGLIVLRTLGHVYGIGQ